MKGGLAVLLDLAEAVAPAEPPRRDVTLVFYEGEEVADEHNGLRRLFAERPDLVAGRSRDPARTDRRLGRGRAARARSTCAATFDGRARPFGPPVDGRERDPPRAAACWTGARRSTPRRSSSSTGSTYRESLQVVRIEGGVANNVVPDAATVVINRRFAPSCSLDDARAPRSTTLLDGCRRGRGRSTRRRRRRPNLTHPLIAELVGVLRPRRAAEAGLDRRRPLRRPRHPGRELRSRRSRARAHRRRAGQPSGGRAVLRRVRRRFARRLPLCGAVRAGGNSVTTLP